jgi:hypothetical protein
MISLVQGCIQEVFRTQGQKVKNMLEARVQSGKKKLQIIFKVRIHGCLY